MTRREKKPFNKTKFKYAKNRLKLTHTALIDLAEKKAGISKFESTYFMDFRKNYRTMDETLNLVAEVLDVEPSYLKGENLISISENDILYSYWKDQNRIDPDNHIMFPFDSVITKQKLAERKSTFLDYLELLGFKGLEDFDTGKMYYFARDQISSFNLDSFEYHLQRFIFDYLKENHFFEDIGYDITPKEANIMEDE